ncbi:G2484-1 protein [Hibiscus syriacus]|uniref:G2484-1 protein n=1 Tax=Hibiscus syriacus TaxID=106335 RepID=A0A6A2XAM0_HIBSY|nr:G2484-1 protein [Hibiscus syriacus]
MGFQGSGKSKMLGSRGISRHKRPKSDSFPGERRVEEEGLSSFLEALSCMKHLKDSVKTKNRQSSTASTEISELEKRLQDQVEVRHAIEIALGYRTWSHYDAGVPISKESIEQQVPSLPPLKGMKGISGLRYSTKQSEGTFSTVEGNHSDPAVRAYTPKRVFQELETAKEEYIRATFGVRNKKILLPKIVESFAKDSSLCPSGLMEMVQQSLPKSLGCSIRKCQQGKSRKSIEWIPHNFNFRYLISKELVR